MRQYDGDNLNAAHVNREPLLGLTVYSGTVAPLFRRRFSINWDSLAGMAELADAQDSGSCVRKDVEVRLLLPALTFKLRSY